MKSKKAIASMLAFTMVLTSVATYKFDNENDSANADAAYNSNSDDTISGLAKAAGDITKDTKAELGTAENPFTVLEVVPYKGMAMLGYLVNGQEPIDMSNLGHTKSLDQLNFVASTGRDSILTYNSKARVASQIDESEEDEWNKPTSDYKEDGYFYKKKVGQGHYTMNITKDDVNYIPNTSGDTFVANGYGLQVPSKTSTTEVKETLANFKKPDDTQKKSAFYKNVTFAEKGSSYKVTEEDYSSTEVIFTKAEVGYTGTTYEPYVINAYTNFYDDLQGKDDKTSGFCYEPSYIINEDGDYEYDPSGEHRYFVLFLPTVDGSGEYKVKELCGSVEGRSVNIPDCYKMMEFDEYKDLSNSTDTYTIGSSYTKDILTNADDTFSSITDGNFEVIFEKSTNAKGVKKYNIVENDDVRKYYINKLFDQLKEGKDKVKESYYPMYMYRSGSFNAIPFDEDTRNEHIADVNDTICSKFGLSDIKDFKNVTDNQENRDKLDDTLASYYYITFEEATTEEELATANYIVSSFRIIDEPSEDAPAVAMCMYTAKLSVAKNSKGLYKVNVFNATFSYDTKIGNYEWQKETWIAGTKTDYLSSQVWIKDQPMTFYTQGAYENNNWFAKKIIGITDDKAAAKYNIRVVTVTPEELNSDLTYISKADLIYMSDNYDDGSTLDRMYLWETYGRDKTGSKNLTKLDDDGNVVLKSDNSYKEYMNFYSNDLSWDATYVMFSRAAGMGNDYVPIVIDSSIYTETLKGQDGRYKYYWNSKIKNITPAYNPYKTNASSYYTAGNGNIYKLYIMLYTKTSPLVFYNEFLKTFDDEQTIEAPYTVTFTAPDDANADLYCYIYGSGMTTQCVKMSRSGRKYSLVITKEMRANLNGSMSIIFKDTPGTDNWSRHQVPASGQPGYKLDRGAGTYAYTCYWWDKSQWNPGNGFSMADGVVFTQGKNQVITTTRNIIQDGSYTLLSGDASKFWNELTFLPISSDTDNTVATLEDKFVNENLISIITSKDANKRVSAWPGINTLKNIFSFNSSTRQNNYSELSNVLLDGAGSTKYLAEAREYLQSVSGYSAAASNQPSWVDVMYYIIHAEWEGKFDVEINNKDVLNVLEIEPCLDFTVKGEEFRKWLPEYTGQVKVTSWISTEYVGKLDDVNEKFDVIYIGTNNKFLNTDFKDNNLDNKVYAHLGDLVTSGTTNSYYNGHNAFWLNYDVAVKFNNKNYHYKVVNNATDNTNYYNWYEAVWFRYSGNDISKVKYNDLLEYVQSKYCVVLADDIYNKNTSKLDTSSYVYQFAKNTVGIYENVFKSSDLKKASGNIKKKFQYYAGQTKLALDISASDDYIIKSTSNDVSGGNNIYDTSSLKYNYSIIDKDASANDSYTVTLYADVNGDGSYSEEEAIAIDTGRKASQYAQGVYTIQRNLTDDFMGILHWALIVEKQDALKHTDTIEGYMLIKNNKAKKQVIRVLQLSSSVREKKGLLMEHTSSSDTSGTLSRFYEDSAVNTYYTIRCIRMTTKEFSELYIPGKSKEFKYFDKDGKLLKKTIHTQKYDKSKDSSDLLKEFDMVVYGFADSVSDISNKYGAYDNIMDFVEEGKALLTSHDTTSMYNFSGRPGFKYNDDETGYSNIGAGGVQSADYMTGLTSSQMLRDKVGMNRFGVPTLYTLKNNISTDSFVHDTAFIPCSDQKKSFSTTIATESDGTIIGSPVNVGYTDFMLQFGMYGGSLGDYGKKNSGKLMYKAKEEQDCYNNSGKITSGVSNTATRVNEGQITKFPYTIAETIKTSDTHGQYYQLNVDDPNLVVWYCLGGRADEAEDYSYFKVSRNDARNYYYLYSYNNVFYTGVGHDTSNSTDDEKRLFVNTMIAAFRASVRVPDIIVTNEESSYVNVDSIDNSVLYYYSNYDPDGNNSTSAFGDNDFLDINLMPRDFNLLSDKMTLKILFQDTNGNYTIDKTVEVGSQLYLIADNGDASTLVTYNTAKKGLNVRSNYNYLYMFPMKYLNNTADGTFKFKMIITNIKGKSFERIVNIGKRSLFMLK